MSEAVSRDIFQQLADEGLLDRDQLLVARTECARSGEEAIRVLRRLGFVSEDELERATAVEGSYPYIDVARVFPDSQTLSLIDGKLAQRYRILPVEYRSQTGQLTVAAADPEDLIMRDQVRRSVPEKLWIQYGRASQLALQSAIKRCYIGKYDAENLVERLASEQSGGGQDSAITDLVDAIVGDAIERSASDIHIGPEQGYLLIRYRVDGVLRRVRSLHIQYFSAIVVRIKVLAGIDIAESRKPQDGLLPCEHGGREYSFRVSTMPTVWGENLVLRLLGRGAETALSIEDLGLLPATEAWMRRLVNASEGLVLVVGPTSSGKTTTLYAVLAAMDATALNIATLEDPIEIMLPQVQQTAVDASAGLDFAAGIRALVRQDPDVMLIGEIRDGETARMALRMAMTGHRVFATLHSPDAAGALPRLTDLGVSGEALGSALRAVIAQRLVRRLCASCRVRDGELWRRAAGGCRHCDFEGYSGRFALIEILEMDGHLRSLISNGEYHCLENLQGHRTLAQDARDRTLAGDTDADEIARVLMIPAKGG